MISFSEDGELLPLDFSTYSRSKHDENKSRYLRVRGFYTDMLSRDPKEFGGKEAKSLQNEISKVSVTSTSDPWPPLINSGLQSLGINDCVLAWSIGGFSKCV